MFDTPAFRTQLLHDVNGGVVHKHNLHHPANIEDFSIVVERNSQEILKSMTLQSFEDLTCRRKSDHFFRWFGESKVTDGQGMPLAVYRGEHGAGSHFKFENACTTKFKFQSRHGALSFGTAHSALIYAVKPNKYDEFPSMPKVMSCVLSMQKPFINQPFDPYIQISRIADLLGKDLAKEIAFDMQEHIINTCNWCDEIGLKFGSFNDYFGSPYFNLADLYFDAYALFDVPRYVAIMRKAGFDGVTLPHGLNPD